MTRLSAFPHINRRTLLKQTAATGAALWSTETGAGVGAPPMSYVVNGRQFVAVATGFRQACAIRTSGTLAC